MGEHRINVDDLRLGMYISALDRPWTDTPFLFQGFLLEQETDLAELRRLCREVVVDADLSRVGVPEGAAPARPPPQAQRPEKRENQGRAFRASVRRAVNTRERGRRFVGRLFDDARLGHSVDTEEAREVVVDLVDNITRDANASLWLTNLKNRDEYTSLHSMNVCVLTLAFCCHLGFPREDLEVIGLGALLHDIGKVHTPEEILNKSGELSEDEFAIMKRHPVDGYEMMRRADSVPPLALSIIRSHHERCSGDGYPDGLSGDEIPIPVLAAAIADVYDALTSDRPYRDSISPEQALGLLHDEGPTEFGEELIESFIRCVGIYPIGSLVELDTGACGLVISADSHHRLSPRVLLVRGPDGEMYQERSVLDLAVRGVRARVRRVVNPRDAGVDVQAVLLAESGLVSADSLAAGVAAGSRHSIQ